MKTIKQTQTQEKSSECHDGDKTESEQHGQPQPQPQSQPQSQQCFEEIEEVPILPYDTFQNILLLGEADFSFTKSFAQELLYLKSSISIPSSYANIKITATEYGNGEDVANRYFNGNHNDLSKSMNSLLEYDLVHEIICGLNARLLGNINVNNGRSSNRNRNSIHRSSNRNSNGIHRKRKAIEATTPIPPMSSVTRERRRSDHSYNNNNNNNIGNSGKGNDEDDQNKEERLIEEETVERRKGEDKIQDTDICVCQRWNAKLNDWDDWSPFWKKATTMATATMATTTAAATTMTTTNHEKPNHDKNQNTNNNNNSNKYDLIIFNFPHSDQAGRATKLVKALFKQLRICINNGKVAKNTVLEMRLRSIETNPLQRRNIRSIYNHEESAKDNGFTLIGCWKSDLKRWEKWGYQHKMTKKNETCRDISVDCKVWRWKVL